MTTATLDHEEIKAEQMGVIFHALVSKGTAYEQSPQGERIGPHLSAAGALLGTDEGEADQHAVRMFAAVALGSSDRVVAMHARSLVFQLVGEAADLNATAIENGNAPQTRFKDF